jgi:hypothetical protein
MDQLPIEIKLFAFLVGDYKDVLETENRALWFNLGLCIFLVG